MSEHVRLTIKDLTRRRQQYDEVIRLLLELDGLSAPPSVKLPPDFVKPGPDPAIDTPKGRRGARKAILRREKVGKETRETTPAAERQGHQRGPKSRFSQYEGVYDGKATKDGRQRYYAGVWIGGKNKRLGTFYSEEEAAAAIQKAKGNKAEAKRLRELAKQKAADQTEQIENNPDRAPRRNIEADLVWQCTRHGCELTFKGKDKPLSCPGCNGTAFVQAPNPDLENEG